MAGSRAERPGVHEASMDRHILLAGNAETSLDVCRAAADVFAYLADFALHGEWEQTIDSVVPSISATPQHGAQFHVRLNLPLRWDKLPCTSQGGTEDGIIEVATVVPTQQLVWRTTTAQPRWCSETQILLEPVRPQITTVRMRVHLLAPRAELESLVLELQERGYPLDVVQRQVDRSLHNLRTILEGRVRPAGLALEAITDPVSPVHLAPGIEATTPPSRADGPR